MRIQHNIAAMNSYRNYGNNVKAVNKNLEKLSSGYKINRAGDDAAGLAISEKMRAQITGLNAAQKNVKDGISLVKTAEGAMQEIHDMLNRMDYLATQSANGTYDNEVDRANLQKEVQSLKSEIDRIADSANFNGIKLLDGSIAGKSQAKNVTIDESTAVKGKYETAALADSGVLVSTSALSMTAADIGKTIDYTVNWKDAAGNAKSTTVSLTFQGDGKGAISSTMTSNYFTDAGGTKRYLGTDGKITAANLNAAIKAGLTQDEEFAAAFKIATTNTSAFEFEAKVDGSAGAIVTGIGLSTTTSLDRKDAWNTANTTAANTVKTTQSPLDAMQKFDATTIASANSGMEQDDIEEKIFEIDGKKFLITQGALTDDQIKALGDDVTIFKAAGANVAAGDEAKELAATITKQTGLETKVYSTQPNNSNITVDQDIVFTQDRLKLNGKDLTLQIGDTADKFNQLSVKVGDMHVSALGVSQIDIGNQDGAAAAVEKIKAAINTVSSVRGDLGAIQNRLDHTANNLSVMAENIQDAESTIRDTDVADEMMSYTKNNILIQSAQAMLAQANQIPQGVLQLLG